MALTDILGGGIASLIGSIGTTAKNLRAAITGKEIETEEGRLKIIQMSHDIEVAALEMDKQASLAQIEVNKIEAASPDMFRAGWRPAVGWLCVAALGYQFLLRPILPWSVGLFNHTIAPMPELDMSSLMTLLCGMLGLGGMRTWEKVRGLQ
jgi:hypothetical protein